MANTSIPWHEAREEGDLNLLCQTGTIGNTPVLEQTMRGYDFVVLRICCERRTTFRGKHDPITRNNWTSWVGYGAQARAICNRLIKGCHVYIRGKIETHEFKRTGATSSPRSIKTIRRETHIIDEIKCLRWPRSGRPAPAPEGYEPNYGVFRPQPGQYRKWAPNPTDSFATFDPYGPMPDDAKNPAGEEPLEEPR